MSLLTVWPDTDAGTVELRTEDPQEITDVLKQFGVSFSRWELRELPERPSSEEVLEAYRAEVDEVIEREGYIKVDAAVMAPSQDPQWPAQAKAAREKFLSEHTHDDDEDRFFARGAGVFYLHIGDRVYAMLCEAGDLLSVPANTTHWFDMGTEPDFVAIRFFHDDDGWVGAFLNTDTAEKFPTFDELMASR
ncbi:acireductone dioxygenase apoprotein [Saccharopolyspora erythraea NRRL 2338]|uniref:Acireductone dioxygenase n=2 Tax=Saccharopolyspora erythraea TaxID=1836 RepID=MTND_SACEN|nr:acireductone dioxygenase [Saccharopolyspora erythraea]A4FFQ4.1 RecName: Full=Acireductone dioxygenase; AltName: Full=1,2-dihydroxy-3-keto-5-methylthiopentene dioxygenase; Short=DHK-MTPene dioxygenase; AltName: Full=Acireductone dioxygenase (Fe(2+)-requiring); Short=ARD'; Short=Fe-ARD; AltName: Full=Acireductone dioxygenase (Ni(2+)-requiring); Short=ARD; Short=Ni-ARD [Saccharopolyspora erythraea NRRL 2338]EQD83141.1 cupin [Saccharopolyspora erythraea D]PFG96597.1 acireductone dioxygenase apopr